MNKLFRVLTATLSQFHILHLAMASVEINMLPSRHLICLMFPLKCMICDEPMFVQPTEVYIDDHPRDRYTGNLQLEAPYQ